MDEQSFESRMAMQEFLSESIDDIMNIIKTLDHPMRFKILIALIDDSKNFSELLEVTKLQRSALGNHLSILTNKNLVEKIVRGLYRLTDDGNDVVESVAQIYLNSKIREQERLVKLQKMIGKYTNIEDETMSIIKEGDLEVKIVKLAPMKVVSFHAMGKEIGDPETKAFEMLKNFANDYLKKPEKYPVYGFNNPDPSPDKEEYGYEFWIKLDPSMNIKGRDIKEIESGLYAVTTTRLVVEDDMIPAWKQLVNWVKESDIYDFHKGFCLEKHLNPLAAFENIMLDLYCPIKEK